MGTAQPEDHRKRSNSPSPKVILGLLALTFSVTLAVIVGNRLSDEGQAGGAPPDVPAAGGLPTGIHSRATQRAATAFWLERWIPALVGAAHSAAVHRGRRNTDEQGGKVR